MSNNPKELNYTQTHEWILREEEGTAVVGITDYAQNKLGDIVYVDLPTIGDHVDVGDDVCVIESVKAAADIYNPIAGEVTEINEELLDAPAMLNTDPFSDGWLYKLKVDNASDYKKLLSVDDYEDLLSEEDN